MNAERWQRVSALLLDAIALPPADRAAFLDTACPDPADRAEVDSLLRHHENNSGFLEDELGALASDALKAASLVPGQSLGAYRILRELGRGGMGIVYLARDSRLERDVAIKLLPAEASHDVRRRGRLRQEARAAAAVPHPGIAQVYAFEEDDDGVGFVVSEYVAGRTLREELDEGPLSPRLAVATAVMIADAAAAAHARGIVHRDLKPENVMRAADGAVKVLDFGLARMTAFPGQPTRSRLTVAGAVMGTPGYMSPEQLRGVEAGVGSDIFALGLMMFEMLTGRHPFAGRDGTTTSTIVRTLEDDPDPLGPDASEALPGIDLVISRCLEKVPSRRFGSMAELGAALRGLDLAPGESTTPRSPAAGTSRSRHLTTTRSSTWWWQFHQLTVSVVYVAMIYPAWKIRGEPIPGWAHNLLVMAIVVSAALATTLRLHGVFTARVHPDQLLVSERRAGPWSRRLDQATVVLLLAAAALALVRDQLWLAALLATVAACATVASLLIEPATRAAAFGATR